MVIAQPRLFCNLCGQELVYFHSPENKRFFVAHHMMKAQREGFFASRCPDGAKVWIAPANPLVEAI